MCIFAYSFSIHVKMKKYILDLKVASIEYVNPKNVLIRLTDDKPLPEMLPGQFVEVRVDSSPSTFLRRPISVHFFDRERNELWLLVAAIGEGTRGRYIKLCTSFRQYVYTSF